MAKIPDASSLGTRLPSGGARGGIVNYRGGEIAAAAALDSARSIGVIGEGFAQIDERNKDAEDKIASTNAMFEAMRHDSEFERELDANPAMYAVAEQEYQKRRAELNARLVNSIRPEKRELLQLALQEQQLRSSDAIYNKARTYKESSVDASFAQNAEQAKANTRTLSDVFGNVTLLKNAADAYEKTGVWDPAKAERARQSVASETWKSLLQHQITNKDFSGAREAIDRSPVGVLMRNENAGKLRIVMDNNKAKAIGGINRASFQAEHDEAVQIFNTQGEKAARAYIAKFYDNMARNRGVYNLDPSVQDVVLDGIANHWSGFQGELLTAAKGGASRQELIDMRRQEYYRLASLKTEKAIENDYAGQLRGWNNRLKALEGDALYSPPPELVAQIMPQLNALSLAETEKRAENEMAGARLGTVTQTSLTPEDFNGDEESYKAHKDNFETEVIMGGYNAINDGEILQDISNDTAALKSGTLPDTAAKEKLLEKKIKAYQAVKKTYLDDPVQFVATYDKGVQMAFQAADEAETPEQRVALTRHAYSMVEAAQRRRGFTNADPSILSKAQREDMKANVLAASSKGSDELISYLDAQKAALGEKYYGMALSEIAPELSRPIRAIASIELRGTALNQQDARDAVSKIASTSGQSIADLKAGIDSDDVKKITDDINSALAPLGSTFASTSFGSGIEMHNSISEGATRLALVNVRAGDNVGKAVEKAVRVFTDGYYISSDNKYRVPPTVNASAGNLASRFYAKPKDPTKQYSANDALPRIEGAAEYIVKNLTAKEIQPPEAFKNSNDAKVFFDSIKEKTYWATNENETGLMLVNENGTNILDNKGFPFEVSFADLVNLPDVISGIETKKKGSPFITPRAKKQLEEML